VDAQVPVLLAKPGHVLSIPSEHMEEPQIGCYETGVVFSCHYDEVPRPQLSNGGQRLATLLVYLSTVGA
jgi:prolyl 4-hydroxylase